MKPDDEVNLSEGRIRWIRERVKTGVKAVFEQLLEEEMTEHLQAECRERTDKQRGERNGYRYRDLITPVGHIEQLQVPRDREGEFQPGSRQGSDHRGVRTLQTHDRRR